MGRSRPNFSPKLEPIHRTSFELAMARLLEKYKFWSFCWHIILSHPFVLVPNRWNQSPSIEKSDPPLDSQRALLHLPEVAKKAIISGISCLILYLEMISSFGSYLGVVYYFLQQDKVNKVNLLSLPPGAPIVEIVRTFKGGIMPF